ncbi:LOW QUALITY PROTEIN: B box and SPRY domain-containing protein [Conger conger]|uniref:LOW QUALITY PROTEIN: B box and SPRY domain-containing protein n=1 Tax=Conger conger TaxID=82655 RepID=UPI002A5AF176|nr:LOW QUALITY PROTEIN: B box and SPRY domain-containing protein [Conger conger]
MVRLTLAPTWRRTRVQASPLDREVTVTNSSSEEAGQCVDHKSDLDWFCRSEAKLICSHCAIQGSCNGHTVTPVARRAADVRNQLVDVCEKMQLQTLRIESFISKTLTAKERSLQVEACGVRERVMAQVSRVREALEEEEQRLLEEVQREEERVQQSLLTQRAHWSQALTSLTDIRTSLVHTLTHTEDSQLAVSSKEIGDRVEEAEGVGEPRDSEQLSLDPGCSNSRLLQALWASTMLLGPSGQYCSQVSPVSTAVGSLRSLPLFCPSGASPGPSQDGLIFDERTVSPLLSLSGDQRTLTFLPRRARRSPQYDPARFDSWPNALCSPPLSGTHTWVLDVAESFAFKVGVCYADMERKGSGNDSRLGYNDRSWVLSFYEDEYSFCHTGHHFPLRLLRKPLRVGVLLDWPGHTLLFYDPESYAVLHAVQHKFTAPLLAACALADHSIRLLN